MKEGKSTADRTEASRVGNTLKEGVREEVGRGQASKRERKRASEEGFIY
jgi:hypothetical protein